MLHILNAGQPWRGRPARALRLGNKRPVALPDSLTVLQDSPPANVVVLANDYDPEGGVLTLVSASALHGTAQAEANGSVTYTPPTGYSGPDTITYVIADDHGQTHSTDVVITVFAPQLSVQAEPDNTLTVNAELDLIDITIVDPVAWAGSYQADTNDLFTGPVNLIAPAIQGTHGLGQTLTAVSGLWIFSTAGGSPTTSVQWQRNGVDISGATGGSYVVQAADLDQTLTLVETLSDTYGTRNASASIGSSGFSPASDGQLLGWWDASDAASITASGVSVSDWADKSGGAALVQTLSPQQPETGVRTLNGLNILDFDGGRFFESPRSLPASGDVAFHMALVIDGVTNPYEAVLAVEATNDFQIDANNAPDFDGRLNAAGIGSPVSLSGGPFAGAIILSAIFDRTGAAQAEVFIGNTSRGTMAYSTALDASAVLHIMTNRSKNAWVNGAVAEIIVSGDIANRADYQTYLSAKWGIS